MSDSAKNTKFIHSEKIQLYRANLIKFIEEQKNQIIRIEEIDEIDYVIGILFLTETNRYFKYHRVSVHGYYMAYTFINLFNKMRKRMGWVVEDMGASAVGCAGCADFAHFVYSLSKNINYLNSRVDETNKVKQRIGHGLSKFLMDATGLVEYVVSKHTPTLESLTKFFYLLLQTAKFMGSGQFAEPNIQRIAEYYANIFHILFIRSGGENASTSCTEDYDTYLSYKNKLNYSLIELNLNSETLDEIISYLDQRVVDVLGKR